MLGFMIQYQYNQMGQEQSKKIQQEVDHKEIDMISDFYEESPQDIEQRMIEAVRISVTDRYNDFQVQSEQPEIEQGSIMISKHEPQSQIKNFFHAQNIIKLGKQKSQKEEEILMEGVLQKQSPSLFGQEASKYCILTDRKFVYKEDRLKKSQMAGLLNFDLLSCYIVEKSHSFVIRIHESDKTFVFRSMHGDKVTKEWSKTLIQVTQQSLGRKHSLTYLSHYHRFWRKEYFSEKEFRETSETGDIILMRGTKNTSILQRAITLDEFDHIAVVLKNARNDVLLFEANGGIGVGIMPWHKFISKKFYKKQEIVVSRKLEINRSEDFLDTISEFVERNMGRKYKFSVKKYLMNRESSEGVDKNSYFCSSLVAKLYKNLQILGTDKSATQYLPSSFAEKQNLVLRRNGKFGNAKLGPQKIIVFEEQFFQKSK